MQMQTQLELLRLRLEGEVGQWVKDGRDVQSIREKVRDTIMPKHPNLYSWVNRGDDTYCKVEIFNRSNGEKAVLSLSF